MPCHAVHGVVLSKGSQHYRYCHSMPCVVQLLHSATLDMSTACMKQSVVSSCLKRQGSLSRMSASQHQPEKAHPHVACKLTTHSARRDNAHTAGVHNCVCCIITYQCSQRTLRLSYTAPGASCSCTASKCQPPVVHSRSRHGTHIIVHQCNPSASDSHHPASCRGLPQP